jgi:hypothetical protein
VRASADEARAWAENELGRSGSLRDPRSSFCWSSIKKSICSPGSAKSTGCPPDSVIACALGAQQRRYIIDPGAPSTISLVHLCPWSVQSDVHCCKLRSRAHPRRHLTHALENMDYNKGLSGASMLTSCSAALPVIFAHLARLPLVANVIGGRFL